MSTPQDENPGTTEAAEAPTQDGYGNDTGFADEAERGEEEAGTTGGAAPADD